MAALHWISSPLFYCSCRC